MNQVLLEMQDLKLLMGIGLYMVASLLQMEKSTQLQVSILLVRLYGKEKRSAV